MGTKNNPGEFDCYDNAHPDEPLFTLRAKDKCAPDIVREWIVRYLKTKLADPRVSLDEAVRCAEKAVEAAKVAKAMEAWKEKQPYV